MLPRHSQVAPRLRPHDVAPRNLCCRHNRHQLSALLEFVSRKGHACSRDQLGSNRLFEASALPVLTAKPPDPLAEKSGRKRWYSEFLLLKSGATRPHVPQTISAKTSPEPNIKGSYMKCFASAFSTLAALILCFAVNSSSTAQESKLATLLQRSPSTANAMSYLHVPSLRKLMQDANLPAELSDQLEEVWLISDLETSSLRPNWEAGYAVLNDVVSADKLAESVRGYVDTIDGKQAVWTPRESYLVPLGEKSLGFLRPAKRPLLASWINAAQSSSVAPYLAGQAAQPESYLSLMVALNLMNSFSPADLSRRVANFETLANRDSKAVGSLLASVKGVSIIVGRKSLSECIFSAEFAESPESLAPFAAGLLSEILNRNGTSAPEVASWKATVDGNKLSLQGPISADSLDGLLGIFSIREHAEGVSESLAEAAPSSKPALNSKPSQSQMLTASQEYFDKVKAYIERVRKYEAQSTGYRAKWDEQQARRIDELPTLGVDPALVDYGADVANALRNNSTAIRTGNVAAGQLQAAQAESFGYGYDSYSGGYYGNSRTSARRGATVTGAQQRMGGFGSYREVIAAIDQMTGEVRRAMTEKYQVQF